jgi:hypothetical protein
MSFKATNGYYVVNDAKSWVYDVDIYVDNSPEKKAVVGFTTEQTEGALFWQCDIDEVITKCYSYDVILKIARDYRDNNRPPPDE